MTKATSSANTNINQNSLGLLNVHYPTLPEQTRIGNFFRTLDDTITLYQRKLDGLKKLKAGYLQQMFPQAGECVPRVRFTGFSGEWEVRKLGEVAEIIAGGDIDKSRLYKVGKYPVYANALTNDGLVGYYESDYRINAPAVTVTGRGDVGYARARKINFTPVVRLLVVISDNDSDFMENAINTLDIFIESTGVPQLTVPQLGEYRLSFPSYPEQTAIGNFFRTLDEQITAQSGKVGQLRQLKAAYLQKMFV